MMHIFLEVKDSLIDAAWSIKYGTVVSLSEQQLLDCTSTASYGNTGCDGGSVDALFYYMLYNPVYKESDYPYMSGYGQVAFRFLLIFIKKSSFLFFFTKFTTNFKRISIVVRTLWIRRASLTLR